MKVATGLHGTPAVDAQEAVQKRLKQMCEFGETLPDGLHDTIHKTVTTMVATKKHVNVAHIMWEVVKYMTLMSSTPG